MEYTYAPDEYLKQLKAYYALEKLSFSADDDRETVIRLLENRSKAKREIADKTNVMVREYVETFEQNPDELTPDYESKLE